MKTLRNKQIVLGITGGIAVYKAVLLLRLLQKADARVRVIMTHNAMKFMSPLTFNTLCDIPVCTDLFDASAGSYIPHVEWAQEADAVIVAPATANIMAKMANGIADDALSTFLLAATGPRVVCPCMNTRMYDHPTTQRNIQTLKTDGYHVIEAETGFLACREEGRGRLPEPDVILEHLLFAMTPHDLEGKNILITAGPTREFIDPVRFISNPSSGKMGYALARIATHRGANVTLVSGSVFMKPPIGVTVHSITSAKEMANIVLNLAPQMDVIIKAAAVSDFEPSCTVDHKVKKEEAGDSISLLQTTDILKELGRKKKKGQILVGFCAETKELAQSAKKKIITKNLDMIVGNLVSQEGCGFMSETNEVTLFFPVHEQIELPKASKLDIAMQILDQVRSKFF